MNTENFVNNNSLNLDNLLIFGTSEPDLLIGTANSQLIIGNEGNDFLMGKDGNDYLFGGAGNDSLTSGRGNNLLLGNKGDDFLQVSFTRLGEAGNNTLKGGAGNDTLNGGDGKDLLVGGSGFDVIFGNEDNDLILGKKDIDLLFGGQGDDTIEGGKGDDAIEGDTGNDYLLGGAGVDILFGGEGNDILIGGKDADIFQLQPNTGTDIIQDFEDGQDLLLLESTLRFGQELTFEQLGISQDNNQTTIAIAETGEILALLEGVSATNIDSEDFISFSDMSSSAVTVDESLMQNALNYDRERGFRLGSISNRGVDFNFTKSSGLPPIIGGVPWTRGQTNFTNSSETSITSTSPMEVGAVTSQAVEVMNVDVARNLFGVDGSGITIGVISDSYDRGQNLITTADDDILSGDLPGTANPNGNNIPVTILDDTPDNSGFNLIDEGRAMIQLIHDVAPGANFLFHSGFNGPEDFAEGIDELVAAGADIIVDDIGYFNEPFFQDGVIAQAADRAFAAGVPYFSAAGNSGRSSYESEFRPVEFSDEWGIAGLENYHFHDFDPGTEVDVQQNLTLQPGGSIFLSFQWDNPFASAGGLGATSDLDIFLLDQDNKIVSAGAESNIGFDAVELFNFTNNSDTEVEYKLLIGQDMAAGGEAPNLIKYIDLSSATVDAEFSTSSSTIFGHPNANGAEAVGASFYQTPREIESFSSAGATPILFDTNGERLPEPEIRNKPEIVAADGTNTTFFLGEDVEGDGFPNFPGTSAAAPHAAGVAALLLEANPEATPQQIYQVLEQTAIDLDDPFTAGEFDTGFDFGSGFGLIQADLALEALLTETVPL